MKRLKLRNALSTRIRIVVSSLCLRGLTLEIKRLLTFVDRLVVDMRKQTKRPTQRRQPTQNRAQETVSAILEAVIRLLKRGGLSAITTNHIAVAAGVSIGSVYQYFPNKQAIFLALHERHINHVDQVLRRRMSQSVGEPLELLVSSLLDGMIEVHASDSELALLLDTEIPHRAGERETSRSDCMRRSEKRLRHTQEFLEAQSSCMFERFYLATCWTLWDMRLCCGVPMRCRFEAQSWKQSTQSSPLSSPDGAKIVEMDGRFHCMKVQCQLAISGQISH